MWPESRSGSKISPRIIAQLENRLRTHVKAKWPSCKALIVRSRGAFAYIDVQGERDDQPEPACRLRYMGSLERWGFAYFTWSREAYESSYLENGQPFGSPEECFDAAVFPILGPSPPS